LLCGTPNSLYFIPIRFFGNRSTGRPSNFTEDLSGFRFADAQQTISGS
jgi:hypothetical protein